MRSLFSWQQTQSSSRTQYCPCALLPVLPSTSALISACIICGPALKVYTKQSPREHDAADARQRTGTRPPSVDTPSAHSPAQRKARSYLKQDSSFETQYFTLTSGNYRAEFHRLHHKFVLNLPLSVLISRHLEKSIKRFFSKKWKRSWQDWLFYGMSSHS